MTPTLSDTLAMVNDTIARVKILEQDNVTDTTAVDSAVSATSSIKEHKSKNLSDSVWNSCYEEHSVDLAAVPDDSAYIEMLPGTARGVYGSYISGDITRNDTVTSIVLVCFFITMIFFSVSNNVLTIQTKKFFGKIKDRSILTAGNINEVNMNVYFMIQTCVLLSVITYIYASSTISSSELQIPLLMVIPAATITFLLYFLIKLALYKLTDSVFDNDIKSSNGNTGNICYITSIQGILLLPVLLVLISSGLDTDTLAIYVVSVVILAKLLAFYNTTGTFSAHYNTILQIILYFCALEVVPLMALYGILAMTANFI